MNVVYARQPLAKSIFLAGPTPRDVRAVSSWRPRALQLLKEQGFTGKVFVPEAEDGGLPPNAYDEQIRWEWEALDQATVVVFWVPRELPLLPAFTTNTEFGLLAQSGKLLLGYPAEAQKMRYLDRLAQRFHMPIYGDLRELLNAAVARCEAPYGHVDGSKDIEL